LGKRIISGLIGGIIVIVTLTCLPSYMCNIAAFLVAVASTYEFIKAINAYGYKPIRSVSYASCAILLFIGAFPMREIYKWTLAFLGIMIIACLIYAFFVRKIN
jgi:CDP-diglyceride synthetase